MSVELTVVPGVEIVNYGGERAIVSYTRLHFQYKAGELYDHVKEHFKVTKIIAPRDVDSEHCGGDYYGEDYRECNSKELANILEQFEMNETECDRANIEYLRSVDLPCILHFH